MNNLNPEIQKILDENGIDPAPKFRTCSDMPAKKIGCSQHNFNPNPNPILKDFFKTLGECLRPIEDTYNLKPKAGWRKDQLDKEKRDEDI